MNCKKSVYPNFIRLFVLVAFLSTGNYLFANNVLPVEDKKNDKTHITIEKKHVDKKKLTRLYHNYDQTVLFFSAKGLSGKVYHLNVFDIDGNIVKQVKIRNNETTVIAGLDKGNYVYETFVDDDKIEDGLILIK